jgi:protein-glutamine gamma-glutamyltransferase
MRRTLLGFAVVAALVAPTWLGLEAGPLPLGQVLLMVGLALLPALALELRRSVPVVVLSAVAATLLAAAAAFDVALTNARPGEADFFGPVLGAFKQGTQEFFDTSIPFDPVQFPDMRGVVLFAAFGFVAAAGLAIAARRPFLALAALLVGAGWPATMASTWVETSRPLLAGALILAASLALLVLLRPGARGLGHAAIVAALLVAVSVGFSTSDAVAKRGFVDWDSWDFYDRPDDPVNVRYVWDSNYDGIRFPEKRTVVFRVKVEGPRRSLYWRATSLDEYSGQIWREDLDAATDGPSPGDQPVDVVGADPLLPNAVRDEEGWVRQDIEVEALRDNRLAGYSQAVRWEPQSDAPAQLATNGALVVGQPLERGHRYTVWSYAPRFRPTQLAEAGTDYPTEADEYLTAFPAADLGPLPPFGTPGREAVMADVFGVGVTLDGGAHQRLWAAAQRVTRGAETPYEAVVLLESWFRGAEGGFTYDESPPVTGGEPPLVAFLENRRGYCQHYAGAMALMLRYLGIPARVAAGFTSGSYDEDEDEWTVTDHNAHTWVEVFFPGHGWVPFDPTPNRGQLTAAYTPFSTNFDAEGAAALGALARVPEIAEQRALRAEEAETAGGGDTVGGGASEAISDTGRSLFGLVFLVLALGAGVVLVVKALRRRLRFVGRDPRSLAAACRRDLVGYLADQGEEVPPSATLRELGALVEASFRVNAAPFVSELTQARYGPPSGARERVRQARRELRALRRRMSSQLALRRRVRGALSLRSLAT